MALTHESLSKIEQFNLATSEIAANTENTLFKSNDALSLGASSEQAITQNVSNIEDLSANLETAAERANALKNRSDDIGRVVEVIKAIAEQSNVSNTVAQDMRELDTSAADMRTVNDELQVLAEAITLNTTELDSQMRRFKY